ncbi:proline dehydrogenase [Actinomadura darangshiensis]|uniref:Proline dehydrogenase n=1 Tax=Actinomadura darangshiensis TaxID=705336 RepID=A0A4R5BFC2_9ACTN|nr:proline dehydrogenase [Actinomadura darangshiensis]TDD82342.1 proline dehydrogenase [Actinomadura darangshiensis]
MDAGLAALLGAAIGSLTTLGAALVNGRTQARTQSAQWRRQHRRDAYAAYLGALHDRDVAMDAVLEALRAERPDPAGVDERVGRFVGLARDVHRATEIVIIEGPPRMAAAADRVQRASAELSELVRCMAANAHAGETARRGADEAAVLDLERRLYKAVGDFRTEARDVLGNTT